MYKYYLSCLASVWLSLTIAIPAYAQDEVVENVNEFAFKLYSSISQTQNGNVVFSPFSISSAFSLLYPGAQGTTAEEIEKAFGIDDDDRDFHLDLSDLQDGLSSYAKKDGDLELSLASAVWIKPEFQLLPSYIENMNAIYNNSIFKLKDAQTINTWASENTKEKIKSIVNPKDIQNSLVVLTSAIYFKGLWKYEFKDKDTKENKFTLLNHENVDAMFMQNAATYKYASNKEFQVLEMPYKGGELVLDIVLPRSVSDFKEMEKNLTFKKFNNILSDLKEQNVLVYLPKFEIEREISMNSHLQSLGITYAFFPGYADFRAMYEDKGENLFVRSVLQKAIIEVNEKGTEAAAVTAVIMDRFISDDWEPKKIIFKADHPFIYILRDARSGAILFMGRVLDPTLKI